VESIQIHGRAPHPIYFTRGDGAHLYDVDENRYLDFVCGNGAIMLGHGHPAVTTMVRKAVEDGITTGSETRYSIEAAEIFLEHVPTAEMVRFTNTGTEAVIHALEIARAATGKARTAKVEGAYHGWHSEVYVSAWPDLAKAGPVESPRSVVTHRGADVVQSEKTLVLPFNKVQATRKLLEDNASDLAAVIIEPVMMDIGYIEATAEYIDMLRQVTKQLGIILIFDELLTGFRVAPGGAAVLWGYARSVDVRQSDRQRLSARVCLWSARSLDAHGARRPVRMGGNVQWPHDQPGSGGGISGFHATRARLAGASSYDRVLALAL
jgi:glutamate-1-semialdehyde 2,1-aminomutase